MWVSGECVSITRYLYVLSMNCFHVCLMLFILIKQASIVLLGGCGIGND